MPSWRALSTRLPVMPDPGNSDDAPGQQVQELVVPAERRGLAVRLPVRAAHHLVDAPGLGPARRDLLDAGAAAVQQDHVFVLRPAPGRAWSRRRRRPLDVLAAGDGDQGALGQVRTGLAVLAGAAEVAGVDRGGGEPSGPAGVRSLARAPDVAGLDAVGVGGEVAHRLECVAAVAEVPGALGEALSASMAFTSVPSWARSRSRISSTILSAVRFDAARLRVQHIDEPPTAGSRARRRAGCRRGRTFSISEWMVCSRAATASASLQTMRLSGSSGPGVAP